MIFIIIEDVPFFSSCPRRFKLLPVPLGRLSTLLCSNIIYSYTCSSCNSSHYGKTSRNLKIRCLKHLSINRSARKVISPSSSSIYQHISSSDYTGYLEDFKIISKNSNPLDLLIYENLLTLVSLIEGGVLIEGGCSRQPVFNRRGCSRQPVFSRRGLLIKGVFQVGQFSIKLDC